jgi:hypothetical protein
MPLSACALRAIRNEQLHIILEALRAGGHFERAARVAAVWRKYPDWPRRNRIAVRRRDARRRAA